MKAEKIWRILQEHKAGNISNEIHEELVSHLKMVEDFYFEPSTKEDGFFRLIYFKENLFVYFQFRLDYYQTKYFNIKDLISVNKTKDYISALFPGEEIKTEPELMKSYSLKNEIENLFQTFVIRIKYKNE